MEVSDKAWRGYTKARKMLRHISMDEMSAALSAHVIPEETQEAIKKEISAGAYTNYLAWEALETLEGLLELMIAIQTMKNDGIITVQDETDEQAQLCGKRYIQEKNSHHHRGNSQDRTFPSRRAQKM